MIYERGLLNYLENSVYIPKSNRMNVIRMVLLRLDQEIQDNSVIKIYSGLISIEHILPQSLEDSYWKEKFTSEQHFKLLHKLGNLTLLSGSKNSKAKNSSFPNKKVIYAKSNGKVSFEITKPLLEVNDWTEQEIMKRHTYLVTLARKIWEVN